MKRRSFVRISIALLVCFVQLTALKAQDRMELKQTAIATNSIVTNHRPGGQTLDMAWLEVEYTNGTPTSYIDLFDNNTIVIQNGQSLAFTAPTMTGVYRISLRHFGTSFPCEEYGTMVINGTAYTGWSSCVESIQWSVDPSLSITGGLTIDVY